MDLSYPLCIFLGPWICPTSGGAYSSCGVTLARLRVLDWARRQNLHVARAHTLHVPCHMLPKSIRYHGKNMAVPSKVRCNQNGCINPTFLGPKAGRTLSACLV